MEAIFKFKICSSIKSKQVTLKLDPDKKIIIGRTQGDFVLSNPKVSGKHCFFIFQNGKIFLHDCQSTNGTRVNGEKIDSVVLKESDEISIGSFSILVQKIEIVESVIAGTNPSIKLPAMKDEDSDKEERSFSTIESAMEGGFEVPKVEQAIKKTIPEDFVSFSYHEEPDPSEETLEKKALESEGPKQEASSINDLNRDDPKIFTSEWKEWIVEQARLVITEPKNFFRLMSHTGGLETPLFLIIAGGLLSGLFGLLKGQFIAILLAPIFSLVAVAIGAVIIKIIVFLSGGEGTLKACFRMIGFSAFISAPISIFQMLLISIPVVGGVVSLLGLYLLYWCFLGLYISFQAKSGRLIIIGGILFVLSVLMTVSGGLL